MKTLVFEALAKMHPGKLSLVHAIPGVVITPGLLKDEMPWWFRWLAGPFVRYVLAAFVALRPEESGERTLFMGTSRYTARGVSVEEARRTGIVDTDGVEGGGTYGLNWDREVARRIDWTSKGVEKKVFEKKV